MKPGRWSFQTRMNQIFECEKCFLSFTFCHNRTLKVYLLKKKRENFCNPKTLDDHAFQYPGIYSFYYRDPYTPRTYLDRVISLVLATTIWYWFLYHLYWDYQMITGHFYAPYLEEFTDEELGIPPDDAPDPEYWGNHGKPYGSYR